MKPPEKRYHETLFPHLVALMDEKLAQMDAGPEEYHPAQEVATTCRLLLDTAVVLIAQIVDKQNLPSIELSRISKDLAVTTLERLGVERDDIQDLLKDG